MFLQVSVCPREVPAPGGGSASVHAGTPSHQGDPLPRRPPCQGNPPAKETPPRETATAADSTHPTGMHSCFVMKAYRQSQFMSIYQGKWVTNPFALKFYSLIQNNISRNIGYGLIFVMCEHTLLIYMHESRSSIYCATCLSQLISFWV